MGRITRTLVMLGGTVLLVAMPKEDYARLWAGTQVTAAGAYGLIEKHIVRPIRIAATSREEEVVDSVPAPRPAIRPSLVTDDARRDLKGALISAAAGAGRPDDAGGLPQAAVEASHSAGEPVVVRQVAADQVEVAGQTAGATAAVVVDDASVKPVPAVASEAVVADGAMPVGAGNTPSQETVAVVPPASGETVSTEAGGQSDEAVPVPAKAPAQQATDADGAAASAMAPGSPPLPVVKPEVPDDKRPPVAAKLLFGAAKSSAPLKARAVGYYSRGCLAGGKALPVDGPAWQAMRLSRNRNWGHPKLIDLIERFAKEVQKEDGWPGLLVGDISQPRGGPMLTGHASHQIGLDADIWFTPMPGRRLSRREREQLSATSMILGPTKIDPTAFTANHVKVVKRAASYREVERILVHPAIKKALCEAAGTDRGWLGKVRPYFGHYYHFHVRLACPDGSPNCRSQRPPSGEDGCDKELDYWFKRLTRPARPKPKTDKPSPPKPPITLADLPQECRVVLESGDGPLVKDEAELVKTSIERSRKIIDISGEPRAKALLRRARQ